MVTIDLKDEEFNSILTKAILDSLSDETKNRIIGDAVKYINEPVVTSSWSDPNKGKTVLQVAFQNAVDMLINKIVLEVLQDTMYENVKEKVADLLVSFPDVATDPALQVKVASTMMEYMREKSRDY